MNKGFRILVVDDDSRFLETSSHLLKSAGYEVIEATSGRDGLRLAKERGPDLLLVGVSLPDMDGFQVCRRIKADAALADSYIALLSGARATSGGQVEGAETGADGYVVRPISNREFLARVRAMVCMKQAEDTLRERTHELDERAKELNCLYDISALLKKPGVSLAEILQDTADLIPSAWQYPEITGARIILEGREFRTKNFRENSPWQQTADIVAHGQCGGAVEVCCVEEGPECDEGPFLREERNLLNAIAERLGRIVERVRAEEALVRERNLLCTLIDSLPDYIYVKDTADRFVVGNVALGRHMGATMPGELVGETDFDFSGQPLINREVSAVDEVTGDQRSYLITQVPVRSSYGKIVGMVGIIRDITERRRTEEELRNHTKRLRQLAQQITLTQEEERQRLSRALHDEAGQALTALKVSLELIEADLPVEFDSLRRRISDAVALIMKTMEQIRLLAQDLRPPALDAVGLDPTLEGYCRDFAERTQLSIDYLGLELPTLPEGFNTCLYRFLQEALTNVVKHACAYHVRIALRHDAETVSLSVEDDGRGFDRQAWLSISGWPMGIGLLGMQERLESLGGRLEIASQPGQGTRLVAHLPVGGIP